MTLIKHHFIGNNIDTLVCSPGGVATTSFMQFIQQYRTINNPWDRDGLKHIDKPPVTNNKNLKAIYIYGDPFNLIISIFRRNYQEVHSRKLLMSYSNLAPISEQESLDGYLEKGIDRLKLEKHFYNWKKSNSSYPVMMIKYEDMWNNLPQIFEYLEIPISEIEKFPKQRKRSANWKELSERNKKDLFQLYGELYKDILESENILITKSVNNSNSFIRQLYIYLIKLKANVFSGQEYLLGVLKERSFNKYQLMKKVVRSFQK